MCCYIKHACKTQLCWASCRWWYHEHFLTITPCAQDTVILLLCKNNQNISLIQVSLLTIQLQYGTTVLTCGLIISTNTIWPWLTNCTDLEKDKNKSAMKVPNCSPGNTLNATPWGVSMLNYLFRGLIDIYYVPFTKNHSVGVHLTSNELDDFST